MTSPACKNACMIQLASRGKEDLKYLSNIPEITLFKTMYRRHTNFAVESIQNNFNGFIGPNYRVTIPIDRKGDLMHKTWIEVKNLKSTSMIHSIELHDIPPHGAVLSSGGDGIMNINEIQLWQLVNGTLINIAQTGTATLIQGHADRYFNALAGVTSPGAAGPTYSAQAVQSINNGIPFKPNPSGGNYGFQFTTIPIGVQTHHGAGGTTNTYPTPAEYPIVRITLATPIPANEILSTVIFNRYDGATGQGRIGGDLVILRDGSDNIISQVKLPEYSDGNGEPKYIRLDYQNVHAQYITNDTNQASNKILTKNTSVTGFPETSVITGDILMQSNLYDMIEDVTVYIGDRQIDRHTGEWMKIVKNLKIDNEKRKILDVINPTPTLVTKTFIRLNSSTTGTTITDNNLIEFKDSGGHDQNDPDNNIYYYDNNENYVISFDAGSGNEWSIKFNSFQFEHNIASGRMYDRLSIKTSTDGTTWYNIQVPWMYKSTTADPITRNGTNGWILPYDLAEATTLGMTSNTLKAPRYIQFNFYSDNSQPQPGWDITLTSSELTANNYVSELPVRIPLSFWFCNNYGNSIPLIHLNEDEVKISIKFNNNFPSNALLSLWVDYVYLDGDERTNLAKESHEYLIEQVQTTGINYIDTVETEVETDFNNAIKEVIWKLDDANHDKITQAVLLLDDKHLFDPRDGGYFSDIQRYSFYSNTKYPTDKTLYMYTFSTEPDKHNQPTGSLNIDGKKFSLIFEGTHNSGATCVVYAVNFNILTFKDGRGILKYLK